MTTRHGGLVAGAMSTNRRTARARMSRQFSRNPDETADDENCGGCIGVVVVLGGVGSRVVCYLFGSVFVKAAVG